MNWEAFLGTIFVFALLAVIAFGGYWAVQFVVWSCTAVYDHLGHGWGIALGITYRVIALAFFIGAESAA